MLENSLLGAILASRSMVHPSLNLRSLVHPRLSYGVPPLLDKNCLLNVFFEMLFSGGFDSIQIVLGKWVQSLIESFISKISNLILVDWTLAREISADRAGLIACQDLEVARQAMINFKLAIDVDKVKINPEDYIIRQINLIICDILRCN